MILTGVANVETLLRLVQSVASPAADPIKLWLVKVGNERMQEMAESAYANYKKTLRLGWDAKVEIDLLRRSVPDQWFMGLSPEASPRWARLAGRNFLKRVLSMAFM